MRKHLSVWLLAAIVLLHCGEMGAQSSGGQNSPGGPDLKTTLEKGLKARRPEEFSFITSVVAKVDAGTLPKSLVNSTFLWARNKRPYPFPYFQQALKVRAKKAGVSL